MRRSYTLNKSLLCSRNSEWKSQADRCLHLKYNFVELPDGAMSSRKGNIVPITDLIEQMKAHVKNDYLTRYESEWTPQEIESTQ